MIWDHLKIKYWEYFYNIGGLLFKKNSNRNSKTYRKQSVRKF